MQKHLLALFESQDIADEAIQTLSDCGIAKEDVSYATDATKDLGDSVQGVKLLVPVTSDNKFEVTGLLHNAGALHIVEREHASTTDKMFDKRQTYKAKDIVGKSIVSYQDGKVLSKVQDVIHDCERQRVIGFLIDESWQLAKGRHVPLSLVRSIGNDAITVADTASILTSNDDPWAKRVLDRDMDIRGNKIISEEGDDIGRVTDFYFNGETGMIEGYEVSRGMGRDMRKGMGYLATEDVSKYGEEIIFVNREVGVLLKEQQTGGVQAVVDGSKVKAEQVIDATKEKVGQARYSPEFMDNFNAPAAATQLREKTESTWDRLKGKMSDMKEQSAQAIEEKRIKGALGRPVTRVIFDVNDNVILNTGDLITHEAVEKAREHNILDALLDSVYKETPEFGQEELRADDEEKL